MGDAEFENFLNDGSGKDNDCPKKLLFEILKLKIDNTTDLIEVFSKLPQDNDFYRGLLIDTIQVSKNAFEQLDYLTSMLIDELNDGLEDEE